MLQRPSMERSKMKNFKDVQVQVDFENEVVNETETKIEAPKIQTPKIQAPKIDAPKIEEKLNCSLRITLENIPEKKLLDQLGIEEKIDEVVNEVAIEKEEEVKKDEPKFVEITEKRRIPWFAGCEYQCQVEKCNEMFFYNQDLRSHIKKSHETLGIDGYLDGFEKFETKEDHIACKECFLNIKRHFSSVFLHLR